MSITIAQSVSLAVVLILIICWYLRCWIRSVWFVLGLRGPPVVPILGNANLTLVSEKTLEFLSEGYEKYGRLIRFWLLAVPSVYVVEPKDLQLILGSTKQTDKNFVYTLLHNFLGQGLITNNGPNWKHNRKLIQPYFRMNILQNFIETFSTVANEYVKKIEDFENVNVTTFINDCVMDILHATILGIRSEDTELKKQSPYRRGCMAATLRLNKPWYLFDSLYKFSTLGAAELQQKSELLKYTNKILSIKRKEASSLKSCAKSLLEMFLEISESNPEFSDKIIVDELLTFMLAGQDSVSGATAFALHYLAKHEGVRKKVVEELDEIFGNSDRKCDIQDVQQMAYLEQCIKETLRLVPTVPAFMRKTSCDIDMGDCIIPSGCTVQLSPFMTHRLPHIFPDPLSFDPERFSPENMKNLHPYAFFPFSAGPRNCIGHKFAILEMKVILSTILRTYHISPTPGKEFTLYYRVTLRAKGGIWLTLKRR